MSNNSTQQDNFTIPLFQDTNVSMKTGRVVKDAELISDGKFIRIRLATNKQYEQEGEIKNLVNYFTILVSHHLDKAFNIAKDLKKGDWAFCKGEDRSKSIDTPQGYKETSVTTFAWEVVKKHPATNQSTSNSA